MLSLLNTVAQGSTEETPEPYPACGSDVCIIVPTRCSALGNAFPLSEPAAAWRAPMERGSGYDRKSVRTFIRGSPGGPPCLVCRLFDGFIVRKAKNTIIQFFRECKEEDDLPRQGSETTGRKGLRPIPPCKPDCLEAALRIRCKKGSFPGISKKNFPAEGVLKLPGEQARRFRE